MSTPPTDGAPDPDNSAADSSAADTSAADTSADTATRTESFPTTTPAELEVHLGAGSLSVHLDPDATTVEVRVRAGQGTWWQQGLSGGLSGVLSMLGGQHGEAGARPEPGALGAEALAATQITFSPNRGRLVVRGPQVGAARAIPLQVQITAPAHSQLRTRTGSASVDVSGTAGSVDLSAGSGDITTQDVLRSVDVRTGSGAVRVGHLAAGGRIRTGSGDLTVDAVAGELDVASGGGDLDIGIAAGVLAELDVRSGAGAARSELPLLPDAPGTGTARIRARTGSGNAVVHGVR